jgi:hypothetical protein
MVSVPVAAPPAVGSNCTLRVAGVPGFTVIGNFAPGSENPAPVTDAELTVTGDEPVAVSVTDCVAGLFSETFPKEMLVALMLSVAPAAVPSCSAKFFETPFAVAVKVADCAEVTAETVAENPALVAFAGTLTEAGSVTALLLLARATLSPLLGAAALRETVHVSVPALVIEPWVQLSALSAAVAGADVPVPLRATFVVPPVDELLAIAI